MLLIETQNRTFLLLPGETEKLLLHSKKNSWCNCSQEILFYIWTLHTYIEHKSVLEKWREREEKKKHLNPMWNSHCESFETFELHDTSTASVFCIAKICIWIDQLC